MLRSIKVFETVNYFCMQLKINVMEKQKINFIEEPSILSKSDLAEIIGGEDVCNCRCGFFIGSYCGTKCKSYNDYCKSNSTN